MKSIIYSSLIVYSFNFFFNPSIHVSTLLRAAQSFSQSKFLMASVHDCNAGGGGIVAMTSTPTTLRVGNGRQLPSQLIRLLLGRSNLCHFRKIVNRLQLGRTGGHGIVMLYQRLSLIHI